MKSQSRHFPELKPVFADFFCRRCQLAMKMQLKHFMKCPVCGGKARRLRQYKIVDGVYVKR